MSLINEDWERVYLIEQMYLKEKEWEEQEYYGTQKPPTKITLKTESMDLLDDIKFKIKTTYKGKLDCEEQRADLYAYLDGKETPISIITETHIIYDNGEHIRLENSDVATLAYIKEVI